MAKTADVLKEIVAKKKEKIALAKQTLPVDEIKAKIPSLSAPRPFFEAISRKSEISLIAELKKASPSRGIIREDFSHVGIAKTYQEAGAQALSVLTEEDFFMGNLNFINEIKNIVNLPVLRKDFILEAYQIYESRFFGADAVLLIAELLSKDALLELMGLSNELGIDYLVEV
ncbi:indole-3-glycerol-phosphate synthase, partial [bacterium]